MPPTPFSAIALGSVWVGLLAATAGQTQGAEKGTLYGGAVVIVVAIGAYLARDYLSHKGATATQAALDREAFQKELGALREQINTLNHALLGIAGRGGLIVDRDTDQKRRHKLGNQLHRVTLVLAQSIMIQIEMGARLGVKVDPNLLEALKEDDDEDEQ